jgi:hypothetical protein
VFKNRPGTIPELMQVITDNCNLIDVPTLRRSFENMKRRITLCLEAEGRHFENFTVVLVRIGLELLMYDRLSQCLSNKDNLHPGNNICSLISLINFIFTNI